MAENPNEHPAMQEQSSSKTTSDSASRHDQELMENISQKADISQGDPQKQVHNLMEFGFDDFDIDDDSFTSMFEERIQEIKEDELVQGKIVDLTKDEVLVDIGFKSLGIIPKAELLNAETYSIGDEIDVFVEKIEDKRGNLILSRRRADFMRIWEDILELYDKQNVTTVYILRRIKGGMVVDLMGIEAFLPGSQIDVRPVRDFDAWVSKTIDVKVVKVNHPSENVVVSHKVLLEEQLAEQRNEIMSKLEKGLVLEGTVKAISDFGVFVDLGGVDGLVHITDLSWGRVAHPSEIVSLDETVKVVVLDFDEQKRRISLGMKQLTPHPWDTIGDKYEDGTQVKGKVVSLTDYGAFIEIEKGIEGLIHISEMSWTQHVKHPSQIVSMGQTVDAIVLNIDKDSKKLALGMKQLEPDPWQDLMVKYPVDSKHRGVVRNLTNFGVFVELEPGVDGLVHISDLSWTKKIRHPGEFVKKGDELDVLVLSVDPEQRRIALGHKQMTDNPWDFFETKFAVGEETEAPIERIIEKGVIVELPDGVDGFVPVSQLSFAPIDNIGEYFKIGDKLPLRVVEFDKEAKKIVLSVVESLRDKDKAVIEQYNNDHPVPNAETAVDSVISGETVLPVESDGYEDLTLGSDFSSSEDFSTRPKKPTISAEYEVTPADEKAAKEADETEAKEEATTETAEKTDEADTEVKADEAEVKEEATTETAEKTDEADTEVKTDEAEVKEEATTETAEKTDEADTEVKADEETKEDETETSEEDEKKD